MLAFAQASASVDLIGRDAPAIAISPAQNFLKPPPVPETPMVTLAGLDFWNSSATASVIGYTVLEPSMAITLGAGAGAAGAGLASVGGVGVGAPFSVASLGAAAGLLLHAHTAAAASSS